MRAAAALLALFALFAAAPARGQAPTLEVDLEPATATVGDLVSATLTLRLPAGDAGLTPRFPDWSGGWGDAEVRAATPPERDAGNADVVWRQRLTLAAYRTGSVPLPPVAVAVPRQPPIGVATPADLAIEIRSVLPDEPEARRPSPPAPPVLLPWPRAFAWMAGALALGALLAFWRLRRRHAREEASTRTRSPWEELEAAVATLDALAPPAALTALSLALRRFLGRSFSMPAAESTTRELGQRLAARGLDPELVRGVVRLLREIDQVKFARATPRPERRAEPVAEALRLARQVDLHLRPPATPEAAA